MTARLTISALQVAGSVIAQQLGLGFVTAVDPTQGQQGLIVGNFLTLLGVTLIFATDLHHLVIAALHDSYRLFRPGEVPVVADVATLVTRTIADAFRVGIQLSGAVPGVRPRVQRRARRAVAPDAADAGLLRRRAALDHDRLPDPADRGRRHDGQLPRLSSAACCASSRPTRKERQWPTNKTIPRRSEEPTQKRLDEALERGDVVKSQEVNTWFVLGGRDADPAVVLRLDEQRPHQHAARPPRAVRINIPVDGRGLMRLDAEARRSSTIAAVAIPFLVLVLAAIAGNMIQHRLVWSSRERSSRSSPRSRRRPASSGCSPRSRWRISSRA